MSRVEQVNELLKQELGNLISIAQPVHNGMITVKTVKSSSDLRNATIFISVLPDNVTGTALKELRKNNSSFANSLKKRLNLKFIPKFTWRLDTSERYVDEIENALKEI